MLLLPKGSDLKSDIFSDLESSKWKGNNSTNYNFRLDRFRYKLHSTNKHLINLNLS